MMTETGTPFKFDALKASLIILGSAPIRVPSNVIIEDDVVEDEHDYEVPHVHSRCRFAEEAFNIETAEPLPHCSKVIAKNDDVTMTVSADELNDVYKSFNYLCSPEEIRYYANYFNNEVDYNSTLQSHTSKIEKYNSLVHEYTKLCTEGGVDLTIPKMDAFLSRIRYASTQLLNNKVGDMLKLYTVVNC